MPQTFADAILTYGFQRAAERINLVQEANARGLPIDAEAMPPEPRQEPPAPAVKVSRLTLVKGDAQ